MRQARKGVQLLHGDIGLLHSCSKEELINLYDQYKHMSNDLLRRAIIDYDRIDLLATQILGYQVQPLHFAIQRFQFEHPKSLQLVFRGAGKSTTGTITKTIHLLLKNPNLRICLASKTAGNAEGFLKEIKAHFENNKKLEEIFGPYFDPRRVTKWDSKEIEVLPRSVHTKESSVTCVGVDGTIVSKHYDVIISDDLVDEENSRTKYMRDRTRTWFYQTLDPCLMPPDSEVRHRGEHHILGTRYHFDDLYGSLIQGEMKDCHQVIPALDHLGRSPWPEMYAPKWFAEKREFSGTIIFNAQYQCNCEAMKGEVFQYDDCQVIDDSDIPSQLKIFQGVDLAITEEDKNDMFADVIIGKDKAGNIYVMDAFMDHISFPKQKRQVLEFYDQWDPIRAGVESNAYQKALYQELKEIDKELRFIPIHTDKDKMTRAWKLSPVFEAKRVFFRKPLTRLIDQFVLFPSHRYKDGVDAFDLAYRAGWLKNRRKRREFEPGLI